MSKPSCSQENLAKLRICAGLRVTSTAAPTPGRTPPRAGEPALPGSSRPGRLGWLVVEALVQLAEDLLGGAPGVGNLVAGRNRRLQSPALDQALGPDPLRELDDGVHQRLRPRPAAGQ